MSNDHAIEQEIIRKGLTAPRVTLQHIESKIKSVEYHTFPGTTITICLITLENGFHVTGESSCASPENFDAELGQKIAFGNAKQKIWGLEGYLLKERLNHPDTFNPAPGVYFGLDRVIVVNADKSRETLTNDEWYRRGRPLHVVTDTVAETFGALTEFDQPKSVVNEDGFVNTTKTKIIIEEDPVDVYSENLRKNSW